MNNDDEPIRFNFDLTSYAKLRDELKEHGIHCGWNSRHQMTVSHQKGAIWPTSNSFWVTQSTGRWLLFPWYLNGYSIRNESEFASLCRRCMESTNAVMRQVPDTIILDFGLAELTESETTAVFSAMNTAL